MSGGRLPIGIHPVERGEEHLTHRPGSDPRPRAPSNAAVLLTGTFESPRGVGSISETTVDAGGGEQPGTRLTLGSSPDWERGDVVKVFADDEIAEARQESGNKSRVGEFMVVDGVSQNSVSLVGRLNSSYTSNVRVARIVNAPVRFEGFRIDTDSAGISAGWGGTTIVISALIRPVLRDLHVRIASAAAILMRGCYAYDVENVLIDRAVNDPNSGLYGYGLLDNSSAYGTVRNLHARRVRHAYTDDTPRISANSSAVLYGATYGTRVIDSVCHGASGAALIPTRARSSSRSTTARPSIVAKDSRCEDANTSSAVPPPCDARPVSK